MDVNILTWTLLWLVYNVQCQHIVLPSNTTSWYTALEKCQITYKGDLANIDEIELGASIGRCMEGRNQMWLNQYSYTTDHLSYKGCYYTPNTFEDNSYSLDEMSIVSCRLKCQYQLGFAIKGNVCKCVAEGSLKDFENKTYGMECQFRCSQRYCGYESGKFTVSLYIKDSKNLPASQNENCVFLVCNQRSNGHFRVNHLGGPCSEVSGVSAYCRNGFSSPNVMSWRKAAEKCFLNGSYLITEIDQKNCEEGLKIWSDVRKYNSIFETKDEKVPRSDSLTCGFTESNEGKINFSDCYQIKQFVCITDEPDRLANAECAVNIFEREQTTKEFYQSEVQLANKTGKIIGIILGILFGAVIITISVIMILKRRGFDPRLCTGSKSNKAPLNSRLERESPKLSYLKGTDAVQLEMEKTGSKMASCSNDKARVTSRSETFDSNNAGDGSSGRDESFSYDLLRPTSDTYDIIGEGDTGNNDDNSSYLVLENPKINKFERPVEDAAKNDDVDVSDNDYDHLRHHHKRVSDTEGDYDYSRCEDDNGYGYSSCRQRTTDKMVEGEYLIVSPDIVLSEKCIQPEV